jgi:hypothetical protein
MDRHSPDIDFTAGIFQSARTVVNARAQGNLADQEGRDFAPSPARELRVCHHRCLGVAVIPLAGITPESGQPLWVKNDLHPSEL